ncbi:MAG: 2-amino-4-hydroxy-6-hydroxymethyldihydropteridine diphosphokinase [Cellvibrionaceae bacterium]|jgi:2-amino-4-hydroxy-6-hydroxymethyldihydropteridine diphosphokinase
MIFPPHLEPLIKRVQQVTKASVAYIGVGSNLNEPLRQVQKGLQALAELPRTEGYQYAQWYQSKAVGPGKQPDYINTVARLDTLLKPLPLLERLQMIENQHGRQRSIRWGARTLDLDLLLYDDECLNQESLVLPHPRIYQRGFVLLPLFDLAPDLVFPDGKYLRRQVQRCDTSDLTLIDALLTES